MFVVPTAPKPCPAPVHEPAGPVGSVAWAHIEASAGTREEDVLVSGFPAGSFAANCYVLATGPGSECLIIDPGQDAEQGIDEIIERYRLRPAAVLVTHGHIDHIWSVAPVCGAKDIPAYIHPADRALLTDPARGLPMQPGQQFLRGLTFAEPADVVELAGGMTLDLAGVQVVVDYAPGHTPGSL